MPLSGQQTTPRMRPWTDRRPLALIACLALTCGCNVLGTGPLPTQTHELGSHPNLAPIMGGPQVDANGKLVAEKTPPPSSPPSELAKVSLPRYRVTPPDILMIQGIRNIPKGPYHLQSSDYLQIVVAGTPPELPQIAGPYQVDSSGMINLGAGYDSVNVAGMTPDEAQAAIAKHLAPRLVGPPNVSVSILQASGVQPIAGEHLIGPDGFISLGVYGSVYVSNMTVDDVRVTIERQLSKYLDQPKVAVEVLIYNSKFFYVISEGAGFGDNIQRIPITGNETVLDAIAQIGGLQQPSSKRMWISRPSPKDSGCDQILPIDWNGITKGASTSTNYQLLPGDRLFIAEDRILAANQWVTRVLNPVERMFGFSLLGIQTVQYGQRFPKGLFQ